MTVRILTEDDIDACYQMFSIKDTSKKKFWNNYLKYFTKDNDRFAFGYFENDVLQSWLLQGFFRRKTDGKKYWVISFLCTHSKSFFSFNNPEIGLLVKEAFENAEAHQYYNYFYVVPEKQTNAYERQWRKNQWGFNGRYELTTIDTIPAHTRPLDKMYWRLMGEEIKDYNVVVKARTLGKQYRPTYIQDETTNDPLL